MANGVTTEWFDLQVKYGNYLPNEKKTTLAEEQKVMKERKEEEEKMENKISKMDKDELDQLEDQFGMYYGYVDDDDEFTKQYMAKRMQEMKSNAAKMVYGQVLEISRDEYIREVTEANPESFVVLHLYQNSN